MACTHNLTPGSKAGRTYRIEVGSNHSALKRAPWLSGWPVVIRRLSEWFLLRSEHVASLRGWCPETIESIFWKHPHVGATFSFSSCLDLNGEDSSFTRVSQVYDFDVLVTCSFTLNAGLPITHHAEGSSRFEGPFIPLSRTQNVCRGWPR